MIARGFGIFQEKLNFRKEFIKFLYSVFSLSLLLLQEIFFESFKFIFDNYFMLFFITADLKIEWT